MNLKPLFSSQKDNWETPDELFKHLEERFGTFTLDPACEEHNKKCIKYYTKEQNGLLQDWTMENVFINPPYGRQIGSWVKKAYEECQISLNTKVVMLLPARTDTKWFHDYCAKSHKVFFVSGRIAFKGATSNAPFPSMIVVFDSRKNKNEPTEYDVWPHKYKLKK